MLKNVLDVFKTSQKKQYFKGMNFFRVEKDKMQILSEITDVRAAFEEVSRSKSAAEKSSKSLTSTLNDLSKKCEEATLTLGDFNNSKRKMAAENADLLRQLQELENVAFMNSKVRDSLNIALEEQKHICDDESKERISLLSKFRNLEHEYDGLREHYHEELMNRENLGVQGKKANVEVEMWKQKYEIEGVQKAEELEMSKLKLQARLSESQNTVDNLHNKQVQLEKAKAKLETDKEELSSQLDQAQMLHATMEKRAKQFDRYF